MHAIVIGIALKIEIDRNSLCLAVPLSYINDTCMAFLDHKSEWIYWSYFKIKKKSIENKNHVNGFDGIGKAF